MKVILISGKSGSGKDTLANFLEEQYKKRNKKVLIIHFADMVKEFAKLYYNWDGVKDEKGRTLLQHLGTDTIRATYPNYWAELVGKFLNAVKDDFDVALIPDLRFLNEYKIVKKYNKASFSIRINKIDENGNFILNPLFTAEQNSHPSECDLDDYTFDLMVNNCGTLDDLKADSFEIINYLEKEKE